MRKSVEVTQTETRTFCDVCGYEIEQVTRAAGDSDNYQLVQFVYFSGKVGHTQDAHAGCLGSIIEQVGANLE